MLFLNLCYRNHNIISYKESFYEDSTSSLCIVMEYADGGDLYNKILQFKKRGDNMPEKEVWHIFIQIIRGLQALHELKIVHRDIKCANIFITKDGVVKLGDLNVSKVAKRGMLQTQTGTPYYASPEVWKDKPYDSKSDIWSTGCVLYEICALNPPFRANDMNGLCQKICKGVYPPIPATYSSDLVQMVRTCLQQSPNQRPSCAQILSMNGTQNHLSGTLQRMESLFEECKDVGLLGTIKVPRNMGQITERLPKAKYNIPSQLKRNSSEPSRIGQIAANGLRDQLQSAKPSVDYGLKGLAPIKEKDEPRSADVARDTGKNHNPQNYQYRMKNQPAGYQGDKENLKLPRIQDKSQLAKGGAAILAAGNRYMPPTSGAPKSNQVLQQIYGGASPHYNKPPIPNPVTKYQPQGIYDRYNAPTPSYQPYHHRNY